VHGGRGGGRGFIVVDLGEVIDEVVVGLARPCGRILALINRDVALGYALRGR